MSANINASTGETESANKDCQTRQERNAEGLGKISTPERDPSISKGGSMKNDLIHVET